ncbi:MAG: HEAT repeat domain-containing protein [Deltaproteobacteria bacterium]|nr:HEAT repeat domain-containing protein [Deltaproteobacteria bacterium]
MTRRARGGLLVALWVGLLGREGWSQRSPGPPSIVVRLLQTSTDARERTSAALALGTQRSPEARAALEGALGDSSSAVRAAAASSLGNLGDPAAAAALRARAGDLDPDVRAAIRRALERLAPPVEPAVPTDLSAARFVVSAGPFANRATAEPEHLEALRTSVDRALRSQDGVALHTGPLPPAAVQRLRRGRLRAYSIQGGVTELQVQHVADMVTVRAQVSLVLVAEPVHAIIGMVSGTATVRQPTAGQRPDAERRLQRLAIESAVEGALRDFESQLTGTR